MTIIVTEMKVFNCAVAILHPLAKTQAKPKTGLHAQYFLKLEIIEHEKFIIQIFVTDMTRRTRHLNVCVIRRLIEASASTRVPPLGRPPPDEFLPCAHYQPERNRAPSEQLFRVTEMTIFFCNRHENSRNKTRIKFKSSNYFADRSSYFKLLQRSL